MAVLSTAYLNARDYARQRVQGPDLARVTEKHSPRVRIIQHPDMRRMLMAQKAHAEGMRALCLYTASIQDRIELEDGHGTSGAAALDLLNDLLLPLVKGYCSERTYDILALSLQCFGGSGYCQDYPIEQYIRDQKIDTLYEGTTHIQALDMILRKIGRDGGATLRGLLGEIQSTVDSDEGGAALTGQREALGRALVAAEGMFQALLTKMGESIYHVGLRRSARQRIATITLSTKARWRPRAGGVPRSCRGSSWCGGRSPPVRWSSSSCPKRCSKWRATGLISQRRWSCLPPWPSRRLASPRPP